jgi:hypothetical protein
MGHKHLLVTQNLHQLKNYSQAKTAATAAPAASFSPPTLPQRQIGGPNGNMMAKDCRREVSPTNTQDDAPRPFDRSLAVAALR